MNFLFENDHEVCVEVVGPGFDASDLQRGDLSPHEAFSVNLAPSGDVSKIDLIRRVDQAAYQESVSLRKAKISRKLESTPSRELAPRIRESLGISADLETHLQKIGSPLCKFQDYQPVAPDLLGDRLRKIIDSRVIEHFSASTGVGFPLVFSTSLVNRGKNKCFGISSLRF